MLSPYQFWIDLGRLLLNPKQLLLGVFDLGFSWLYTRNWMSLLFMLPMLFLALFMVGSSTYVDWMGPAELTKVYWRTIEQENQGSTLIRSEKGDESTKNDSSNQPARDHNTAKLMSQENLSQYASSLLLKVLQLEGSDARANYLAASTLGNRGRLAQARQLMRRIAPENERGFAPAHAWLAADRLQSLGVRDQRDLVILMSDLAEARRWSGTEPMLMSVYADLLIREGKVDEAIAVLRAAGNRDSRLLLKLASIAQRQGNQRLFEGLCQELEGPRQERHQKGLATELDFIELTSLRLIKQESAQASKLAQAGLQQYPQSAQLKRLLSSAYMMAFEFASKNKDERDGNSTRLELLDLAMKSDPSNPAVQEKIAELTASGEVLKESIAAFLREQLADGKATGLTHLLLAFGHLRKTELDKAIIHLEVAHSLAPGNPIVLNNLALCIARIRPEELPRAKQLIEVAIAVAGANAEFLDTYGEILSIGKDYVGAIRALEAALSINQDRPETRRKLAEAYTQVALDDMAESVKKGGDRPKALLNQQDLINKANDILSQPAK